MAVYKASIDGVLDADDSLVGLDVIAAYESVAFRNACLSIPDDENIVDESEF